MSSNVFRRAFTLIEMLATVVLIGIVATIIIVRVWGVHDDGKRQACYTNRGDIEVQVQRWWRISGGPPNSNLSDIYADDDYFPNGALTCPVDGTAYTIDTATGEVIGHTH